MDVHFSSKTYEWETPKELFAQLDQQWHFTLDVCATSENAKCARYFTLADDGLSQEWGGVCWMNPPYGREIGKWVAKAARTAQRGHTVVCLLPARTDTAWWHDYVIPYGYIRYIRGRLRFGGAVNSAPFPSAIVVFYAPPRGMV